MCVRGWTTISVCFVESSCVRSNFPRQPAGRDTTQRLPNIPPEFQITFITQVREHRAAESALINRTDEELRWYIPPAANKHLVKIEFGDDGESDYLLRRLRSLPFCRARLETKYGRTSFIRNVKLIFSRGLSFFNALFRSNQFFLLLKSNIPKGSLLTKYKYSKSTYGFFLNFNCHGNYLLLLLSISLLTNVPK